MLKLAEYKFALHIGAPAGESSRTFFYIMFGIVASSKCKKFHHLAGEIFVGMIFLVLLVIQEVQHSCRFGNFFQQRAEITQGIASDYIQQALLVKNIQVPAGKMTIAEKSHFFTKLGATVHHC